MTPLGGSGGNFSVRYEVSSSNGQRAFLKALDIAAVMKHATDVAAGLQWLADSFVHEREVVRACADMSRVVRGLDSGEAVVPHALLGRVPYLIFEMADHGDIRRHMTSLQQLGPIDVAWKLRALHHIAIGIQQLHAMDLVHQDLKPSNVLVFNNGCKIGDLGCASRRDTSGPWDKALIVGDINYSPIECFYGVRNVDWNQRRGHDVYLLGSMVVFMFLGVSMHALIQKLLDPRFHPSSTNNAYSAVLPYVQNAFALALAEFRSQIPNTRLAHELSSIIAELCNPDPALRGIPQINRARPRFALEVYVSKFNRLARREELAKK